MFTSPTSKRPSASTPAFSDCLSSHALRRGMYFSCGAAMLLIFDPARTQSEASYVGGAPIPPHGTQGAGHVAFSVDAAQLPLWRQRLESAGVAIESEVSWPSGGESLYVRDPAGNSVELATPQIWGLT